MYLPKFPHSAMFVGVTVCGKTEFLLKLLETVYKNHFEFIVFCVQQSQIIRHTFLGNGFLTIGTFLLLIRQKEN